MVQMSLKFYVILTAKIFAAERLHSRNSEEQLSVPHQDYTILIENCCCIVGNSSWLRMQLHGAEALPAIWELSHSHYQIFQGAVRKGPDPINRYRGSWPLEVPDIKYFVWLRIRSYYQFLFHIARNWSHQITESVTIPYERISSIFLQEMILLHSVNPPTTPYS